MDIFDQLTAGNAPMDEPEVPENDAAESSRPDDSQSVSQPAFQPEEIYTPLAIKQCCQELLKCGLLEMDRKPRLYRTALTRQEQIQRLLEPLDLRLRLDDIRGLAFLTVAETALGEEEGDDWTHPLVRRQRLTLEQSLLVAILRRRFLTHEQESGVGAGGALVYVDDLIPELQIYLQELGSDAKEQTRVRNLLEKLKGHGIVSEIDNQDQVTIRPIIAHLANPENLQALLEQYRRLAGGEGKTP